MAHIFCLPVQNILIQSELFFTVLKIFQPALNLFRRAQDILVCSERFPISCCELFLNVSKIF